VVKKEQLFNVKTRDSSLTQFVYQILKLDHSLGTRAGCQTIKPFHFPACPLQSNKMKINKYLNCSLPEWRFSGSMKPNDETK